MTPALMNSTAIGFRLMSVCIGVSHMACGPASETGSSTPPEGMGGSGASEPMTGGGAGGIVAGAAGGSWVHGGDGGAGSAQGASSFWFEAECAELASNLLYGADVGASGGQYLITAPRLPEEPDHGDVYLPFATSKHGAYVLWLRIATHISDIKTFSLWLRIDDEPWFVWESIEATSEWTWTKAGGSGGGIMEMALGPGLHTIALSPREERLAIDKLHITSEGTEPTGFGEEATNCE